MLRANVDVSYARGAGLRGGRGVAGLALCAAVGSPRHHDVRAGVNGAPIGLRPRPDPLRSRVERRRTNSNGNMLRRGANRP
jgi:hypothetical protein